MSWLFPLVLKRLHVGDLQVVGWVEGLVALATLVKSTRVGLGALKTDIIKEFEFHFSCFFFSETQLEVFDQVASQKRLERWAIDHEGYVAPYAETMLTLEEYYEMFK